MVRAFPSPVILTRTQSGVDGKFGFLEVGRYSYRTGELPWHMNIRSKSCIPAGEYRCKWTYSPRFKRFTYQVMDVPGRSGIRFHPANYFGLRKYELLQDVDGCIGLGYGIGESMGQRILIRSRAATQSFEQVLDKRPFTLRII